MNSDNEPRDDRPDRLRSQEPLDDERLSAYVDDELIGLELARVESRLRQDAEARRWVAELRRLSGLVQSLPRGRADPDLCEQVLRRVNEQRLSSEWKQPVRRTLTWTDKSYGGLRRWLWSGLAIAAVLLLMFLQPGQPEAENRVADAQPGPVRSGSVRSGSVRSGPAKEKRVIPERAKEKGESQRMGRMVVQIVLPDPRRDRPWFRQLLTEHGMKSLEEIDSSPMADALSEGTEEEGPRRQAARGRPPMTYPGELMETVIVETLPEQLRGLLQACRTNPELHATVGWMSPEVDSLAGPPDWDALGEAGAENKNRYDKQHADEKGRLQIAGGAAGTARIPVRVRFELRTRVPAAFGREQERGKSRRESQPLQP